MKIAKIVLLILFACMPLQAITDSQEQEKENKKSKKRAAADAALFLIGISGICGWGYTLYWWRNNGLAAGKSSEQPKAPLTAEQFVAQQIKLDVYKDFAFTDHDIAEIIDIARDTTDYDLQQQIVCLKNYRKHKAEVARGTIALALQEWQRKQNTAQQT
jgi:hypothetical protein